MRAAVRWMSSTATAGAEAKRRKALQRQRAEARREAEELHSLDLLWQCLEVHGDGIGQRGRGNAMLRFDARRHGIETKRYAEERIRIAAGCDGTALL